MLKKSYVFRVIDNHGKHKTICVDNPEEFTTPLYGLTVLFEDKIYNKQTKKFEKIVEVKREDSDFTREKLALSKKNPKDVSKEDISKYGFCSSDYVYNKSDYLCEDYKLSYTDSEIKNVLSQFRFEKLFSEEKNIEFVTEENSYIADYDDVLIVTNYGRDRVYKLIIETHDECFIDVIMCKAAYSILSSTLTSGHAASMITLNMQTGMTYYFESVDLGKRDYSGFKNVTTSAPFEYFCDISDEATKTIIDIIKEFWNEKYGVTPECVDLGDNLKTLRSYNFNPMCNVLYLYKPFFNSRFRNFFKRDDISSSHFSTLCKLINIPDTDEFYEFAIKNNLFLAKCIYDAGITNANNIKTIIDVLCNYLEKPGYLNGNKYRYWTTKITKGFIDKFYSENTDYLYRENTDYETDVADIEDLCIYIKTALTYSSEDDFVKMFARSFVQHNKYWERSLHQIATLIAVKDCDSELLRKACVYGLNKIQSDNIDLAYDQVITKNKPIDYSADEMKAECTIGSYMFKFPMDTYENLDYLEKFHKGSDWPEVMSQQVARGRYKIIYVKNEYGDLIGYLKYRGIFLLEAKFLKSAKKPSADGARIACIEWCDRNNVKQYRCNDLKTPF